MSFKETYPDFAAIEAHIKRARVERSLAMAVLLADIIDGTWRGLKKVGAGIADFKASRPARPVATTR